MNKTDFPNSAVAIIGMACRFPKAPNTRVLWENLKAGREGVSRFTPEELRAAGVPQEMIDNPRYVGSGGVIDDTDRFDAEFFGFSPRAAQLLDPQHRMFLQTCWNALEDAGVVAARQEGKVGVFAGVGMSSYYMRHVLPRLSPHFSIENFEATTANDKDYLPTLVSYKLNLRGPSVCVQTACSTSLVATHLAVQSLLLGDCDLAIAGGASARFPQVQGYIYEERGLLSRDGHCRTFDDETTGLVPGNGVGAVVLKRLEDAIADHDPIYAVIRASAINNDGNDKAGYTAPSSKRQSALVREALDLAGVSARSITYVETHGTGTKLGDPIEIAGLTGAYRQETQDKGFCAVGALKSNLGHMDTAAGVGGLIKTALCLKHGELVPTLNFKSVNKQIPIDETPFVINTEYRPWVSEGPRRAGVSSFGIGGTNVHIILEEFTTEPLSSDGTLRILPLSAKTPTALENTAKSLATALATANVADVAETLTQGRATHDLRKAVVATSGEEAAKLFESTDPETVAYGRVGARQPAVAFLFPGQGSQHVGMAKDLYATEPRFRATLDAMAAHAKATCGIDLPTKIFVDDGTLDQTEFTQPALFAIEYALADLWQSRGVQPSALSGHSLGEITAACVAGVMGWREALEIVCERGRLIAAQPAGKIISVFLSAEELRAKLPADLALAGVNAPKRCIVSGPVAAVDAFLAKLESEGVSAKALRMSFAAHSPLMDGALAPFRAFLAKYQFRPPRIPVISNLTGDFITPEEATSPDYWVRHLRGTVEFWKGVQTLRAADDYLYLEVGPHCALGSMLRAGRLESAYPILASLPHPTVETSDARHFLLTNARLWALGVPVSIAPLPAEATRGNRVHLPGYVFDRGRYWIDAVAFGTPAGGLDTIEAPKPEDGAAADYAAPTTEMEALVAEVWQSTLKIPSVGVNASFYDLGGDSITATQIVAKLMADLPFSISIGWLLQDQTVAKLAVRLDAILNEELAQVAASEGA